MGARVPIGDVVDALALTLFENPARRLVKSLRIDRQLLLAGIPKHPTVYVARVLFYSFALFLLATLPICGTMLPSGLPITIKLTATATGVALPLITLALGFTYPQIIASERRSSTENELPFFMAYISTMTRGGVSVDRIIERVANLRVFKAIRNEARRIMLRIGFFGDDPISAIEHVAKNHPSPRFRDILLGYVTTLRTGGDVLHYLEIRTQELFASRATEIKQLIERLSSILELYIIIGVITSITLSVFFAVTQTLSMTTSTASGISHYMPWLTRSMKGNMLLPVMYNFVVLPILGIVIIVMAHSTQPKNLIPYNEPYLTLITVAPFSVIAFALVLNITGGNDVFLGVITPASLRSLLISIGAMLLILSLPPWITYSRQAKKTKGIIQATSDFLRDLSETRKTGLSPEKCIIMLSKRDYDTLTPVIRKVGGALATGMSLERALRNALRGVKEWFVVAVFRFLVDSVSVGGGSPEIIDALARFTQNLAECEVELRRRLRGYVALPYFGALMLSGAPILIVYLLASMSSIAFNRMATLVLSLSVGALINNYLMGLVAGKVSEMALPAGFKHAALMTLITVITTVATLTLLYH